MKEVELAERIGVARTRLKDLREKEAHDGVHWEKTGGAIVWRQEGLELVGTALGVDVSGLVGSGPLDAADGVPVEKKARVVKRVLNPRIVMAELDGEEIRVAVRSSENFIVGMEITVRHVQKDLYDLVGRCPRARGRW